MAHLHVRSEQCSLPPKDHRPKPAYLQNHHVIPLSWSVAASKTNPLIMLPVCGTHHDNIHDCLNEMVRQYQALGNKALTMSYPFQHEVIATATKAWSWWLENAPPSSPHPPFTVSHGAILTDG